MCPTSASHNITTIDRKEKPLRSELLSVEADSKIGDVNLKDLHSNNDFDNMSDLHSKPTICDLSTVRSINGPTN